MQKNNHAEDIQPEAAYKPNISRIMLIGAGGVGGFLAHHLGLLTEAKELMIVDGDSFERSNMSRQGIAFTGNGENKAEATQRSLIGLPPRVIANDQFITEDNFNQFLEEFQPTLLVSAVDNDEARRLIFAKNKELPILWGANELWSPQAGISLPIKPWSPLEAFQSAEASGHACGLQTVHANSCAAAMAAMLLALHASPHEQSEKLPIFMSKMEGEKIFQMFLTDL